MQRWCRLASAIHPGNRPRRLDCLPGEVHKRPVLRKRKVPAAGRGAADILQNGRRGASQGQLTGMEGYGESRGLVQVDQMAGAARTCGIGQIAGEEAAAVQRGPLAGSQRDRLDGRIVVTDADLGIRERTLLMSRAAMMLPSSPQLPPKPVGASHSVTAAPPSTAIFFSLLSAKKPIQSPDGEKNGP